MEFVILQIGVIPALINFHLRVQPLKHSIEVAKSKALIYGRELGGGAFILIIHTQQKILTIIMLRAAHHFLFSNL